MNKEDNLGRSKKPRPQARDNLNSRVQEDQYYKGADVRHNEKYERHNKQKKR
jgi:hypothetical protein